MGPTVVNGACGGAVCSVPILVTSTRAIAGVAFVARAVAAADDGLCLGQRVVPRAELVASRSRIVGVADATLATRGDCRRAASQTAVAVAARAVEPDLASSTATAGKKAVGEVRVALAGSYGVTCAVVRAFGSGRAAPTCVLALVANIVTSALTGTVLETRSLGRSTTGKSVGGTWTFNVACRADVATYATTRCLRDAGAETARRVASGDSCGRAMELALESTVPWGAVATTVDATQTAVSAARRAKGIVVSRTGELALVAEVARWTLGSAGR